MVTIMLKIRIVSIVSSICCFFSTVTFGSKANDQTMTLACSPIERSQAFINGIPYSDDPKWTHWTDVDRSRYKPILVEIGADEITINGSGFNPFRKIPQEGDWRIFAKGIRELDMYYEGDKKPFGSMHELLYLDRLEGKICLSILGRLASFSWRNASHL